MKNITAFSELPKEVDKELRPLLEDLLKVGYQIGFEDYRISSRFTYAYIAKGSAIMYVRVGLSGYEFSTVHKPRREIGTGFGVEYDYNTYGNDCVRFVSENIGRIPMWVKSCDREKVRPYKSLEDMLERATVDTYAAVDTYILTLGIQE